MEEQRRSARVKQVEKVMNEEETGIKFELLGEEGARNDGRMSAPSLRQLGGSHQGSQGSPCLTISLAQYKLNSSVIRDGNWKGYATSLC